MGISFTNMTFSKTFEADVKWRQMRSGDDDLADMSYQ